MVSNHSSSDAKLEQGWTLFKSLRDARHKARMLSTTERDKIYDEHPYAKFVPHVYMNWSCRQDVDLYEMYSQWYFFVGFLCAHPASRIVYGNCMTKQRILRLGLKLGTLSAAYVCLRIYFHCPHA